MLLYNTNEALKVYLILFNTLSFLDYLIYFSHTIY